MDEIESEKPDIRFSEIESAIGEGLANHPRSQIAP